MINVIETIVTTFLPSFRIAVSKTTNNVMTFILFFFPSYGWNMCGCINFNDTHAFLFHVFTVLTHGKQNGFKEKVSRNYFESFILVFFSYSIDRVHEQFYTGGRIKVSKTRS